MKGQTCIILDPTRPWGPVSVLDHYVKNRHLDIVQKNYKQLMEAWRSLMKFTSERNFHTRFRRYEKFLSNFLNDGDKSSRQTLGQTFKEKNERRKKSQQVKPSLNVNHVSSLFKPGTLVPMNRPLESERDITFVMPGDDCNGPSCSYSEAIAAPKFVIKPGWIILGGDENFFITGLKEGTRSFSYDPNLSTATFTFGGYLYREHIKLDPKLTLQENHVKSGDTLRWHASNLVGGGKTKKRDTKNKGKNCHACDRPREQHKNNRFCSKGENAQVATKKNVWRAVGSSSSVIEKFEDKNAPKDRKDKPQRIVVSDSEESDSESGYLFMDDNEYLESSSDSVFRETLPSKPTRFETLVTHDGFVVGSYDTAMDIPDDLRKMKEIAENFRSVNYQSESEILTVNPEKRERWWLWDKIDSLAAGAINYVTGSQVMRPSEETTISKKVRYVCAKTIPANLPVKVATFLPYCFNAAVSFGLSWLLSKSCGRYCFNAAVSYGLPSVIGEGCEYLISKAIRLVAPFIIWYFTKGWRQGFTQGNNCYARLIADIQLQHMNSSILEKGIPSSQVESHVLVCDQTGMSVALPIHQSDDDVLANKNLENLIQILTHPAILDAARRGLLGSTDYACEITNLNHSFSADPERCDAPLTRENQVFEQQIDDARADNQSIGEIKHAKAGLVNIYHNMRAGQIQFTRPMTISLEVVQQVWGTSSIHSSGTSSSVFDNRVDLIVKNLHSINLSSSTCYTRDIVPNTKKYLAALFRHTNRWDERVFHVRRS
jgi:hypothetical protein